MEQPRVFVDSDEESDYEDESDIESEDDDEYGMFDTSGIVSDDGLEIPARSIESNDTGSYSDYEDEDSEGEVITQIGQLQIRPPAPTSFFNPAPIPRPAVSPLPPPTAVPISTVPRPAAVPVPALMQPPRPVVQPPRPVTLRVSPTAQRAQIKPVTAVQPTTPQLAALQVRTAPAPPGVTLTIDPPPVAVPANIDDIVQQQSNESAETFAARRELTRRLTELPQPLNNYAVVVVAHMMLNKARLNLTYEPDVETALAHLRTQLLG